MSGPRQRRQAPIGIVVPVLDEAIALPRCLDRLRHCPWPVWVVDGGSRDASTAIARSHPAVDRWLQVGGGRHHQLNAALAGLACTWMVILPADARLPATVLEGLADQLLRAPTVAGCLRVGPSDPSWGHRWRAALSRWRARLTGAAYLDQVPWFHCRSALAAGGFRACGPYDSADLGRRLRRRGRFRVLTGPAVASCREYHRNGWWHTFWRHQGIRVRRWSGGRGTSGTRSARWGAGFGTVGRAWALTMPLLVVLGCSWSAAEGLDASIVPPVIHLDITASDPGSAPSCICRRNCEYVLHAALAPLWLLMAGSMERTGQTPSTSIFWARRPVAVASMTLVV